MGLCSLRGRRIPPVVVAMLPRELWYSNKTCHQREIEAAQALHRSRLATIKPTSQGNTRPALDLTRPETLDLKHMKYNSKKMQVRRAYNCAP